MSKIQTTADPIGQTTKSQTRIDFDNWHKDKYGFILNTSVNHARLMFDVWKAAKTKYERTCPE